MSLQTFGGIRRGTLRKAREENVRRLARYLGMGPEIERWQKWEVAEACVRLMRSRRAGSG